MSLKIIGGTFKGRVLKSPKVSTTRPTQSIIREAVFNICQNKVKNADFLDLFAGTGAMGLEALSRGAKSSTFIEKDRRAVKCIEENIKIFGLENQAEVILGDVLKVLSKISKKFELVYIDPPYKDPTEIENFLGELEKNSLLNEEGEVFFEEPFSKTAQKRIFSLKNLEIKNSRKFGKTLLHQFIFHA